MIHFHKYFIILIRVSVTPKGQRRAAGGGIHCGAVPSEGDFPGEQHQPPTPLQHAPHRQQAHLGACPQGEDTSK